MLTLMSRGGVGGEAACRHKSQASCAAAGSKPCQQCAAQRPWQPLLSKGHTWCILPGDVCDVALLAQNLMQLICTASTTLIHLDMPRLSLQFGRWAVICRTLSYLGGCTNTSPCCCCCVAAAAVKTSASSTSFCHKAHQCGVQDGQPALQGPTHRLSHALGAVHGSMDRHP